MNDRRHGVVTRFKLVVTLWRHLADTAARSGRGWAALLREARLRIAVSIWRMPWQSGQKDEAREGAALR
jgi:hypothetical protein